MNASILRCATTPTPKTSIFHNSIPTISASLTPNFPKFPSRTAKPLKVTSKPIPARDRVMEFGKHKGKMLGTLPSTYLKWVSNNLRARDFEEWANLADEVLSDPVYKDRIEWEYADKALNGDAPIGSDGGAVAELLEISRRYGWDNEDKVGWSKVDFGLLGTSKGGRIPRVSEKIEVRRKEMESTREEMTAAEVEEGESADKRRERRERLKMRLRREKLGLGTAEEKGGGGLGVDGEDAAVFGRSGDRTAEIRSRFPGRESLLKKAIRSRNKRLSD